MRDVSNSEDILDSRDIERRIEELESTVLPWRARLENHAGVAENEAFATYAEAREALSDWLFDLATDRNSDSSPDLREASGRVQSMPDNETATIEAADVTATIERNDDMDEDEAEELRTLKEFRDEVSPYCSDWEHGATLIRDSYFTEYAEELAEDIGAINPKVAGWPLNCIDWEKAARELKMDYTSGEFDGVTYWVR
jgi:hypothetical protein